MPASPFMIDLSEARRYRGWFLFLGILLIVMGFIALSYPVLTTLYAVMVYGICLGAAGIGEIVTAFGTRTWGGFFLHLLSGIVDLVLGGLLVTHELSGAIALTLVIGIFLTLTGIFHIVFAVSSQYPNWGWGVLSGVITLVLGQMIWNSWPYSGLWFIGTCVGIELLFRGWTWVLLALSLGTAPPQEPAKA